MGPQKIIFNGDPGNVWVNDTQRVQYQFVCALINTCGFCLQYHMAIGAIWGIPMHRNCRCQQKRILVGAAAPNAFVDFRDVLENMSHADQVAAIGASNYRLLREGVVKWTDIVSPNRVRDLREVVANKRLSVKTMVDIGIKPRIAEIAHATVNTPAHILAEQKQMELARRAMSAGIHINDLTNQLGKTIAGRVSIKAGPDSYGSGPAWKGGPVAPPSWSGPGRAAELANLLGSALPKLPAPKPASPPPTSPSSTEYGKEFTSEDSANEWGKEHYAVWGASLSDEDRRVIQKYRGVDYRRMNDYLRGDHSVPETAAIIERIEKLDAILHRAVTPEAVTVVRFADLSRMNIDRASLRPGAVILDNGFKSTSVNLEHSHIRKGDRFEIRLPKGTPGGFVPAAMHFAESEAELILPTDVNRFRVVGVKDDAHKTIVLEVIPHEVQGVPPVGTIVPHTPAAGTISPTSASPPKPTAPSTATLYRRSSPTPSSGL